jgi:hypothetical protein
MVRCGKQQRRAQQQRGSRRPVLCSHGALGQSVHTAGGAGSAHGHGMQQLPRPATPSRLRQQSHQRAGAGCSGAAASPLTPVTPLCLLLSCPSRHMWQSVTLHTNLGDVKIELFCEQVCQGGNTWKHPAWQSAPILLPVPASLLESTGAQGERELPGAVCERLLRWRALPQKHQGLHDSRG